MFKKILAPVDLSEPEMTKRGIDVAVEIAKVSGGSVRLVNVQQLLPVAFMDFVPPTFDAELRENTQRELKEVADKVDLPADRVTTALRFGQIYPEVLGESDDWGADLIIVCSHRPSMASYLLGSNAKTIVGHAKCSVLVVRD
jgi:nucleotide-binding universal stress UspA family protein